MESFRVRFCHPAAENVERMILIVGACRILSNIEVCFIGFQHLTGIPETGLSRQQVLGIFCVQGLLLCFQTCKLVFQTLDLGLRGSGVLIREIDPLELQGGRR